MARGLRLLLGLVALVVLIAWVWRDWHRHAPPHPPTLQAGRHGNRHLPEAH